jgi:hypothetical protein
MQINVAALGSRPQRGSIDVEIDGSPWQDVLALMLPRHADINDLDDEWQRLDGLVITQTDAAILRIHPGEEEEYLPRNGRTAPGLEVLRRRSRAPLYLLYWAGDDYQLTLASVHDDSPPVDAETQRRLIQEIARAELSVYASDPRARLPRNDSFHYVGPNGQHYRSFIRVQSVLQIPDRLDSVSFWLLPFVEPETVVLLDTSTISVVGLHLGQYLRETGLSARRSVRSVHPMRGYDSAVQEVVQRQIEALVARPEERQHALVLVSVVGTGGLALRGRSFADHLHFDRITAVGIYGTGTERENLEQGQLDRIIASLDEDLGRCHPEACPACSEKRRGRSPALIISRDSYQVEVAHRVAAELNQTAIETAVEIVARYPSAAFSVHRQEPIQGLNRRPRHHGIFVDIAELLRAPDGAFVTRLLAKAGSLRPDVDVVLTPEHPTAREMGRLISTHLGLPEPIHRNSERFGELTTDERRRLTGTRVLLVDDAIISGSRLRGYRMDLLTHRLDPRKVHVLAGVCRPPSRTMRASIAGLADQLGERENTLHTVEDLLLPNLNESTCPWCWERDLLLNYGRLGEEIPPDLIDRVDRLDTNGLENGLFWGWRQDDFRLGPGSVLGEADLTQAQIFTIVAAGLQRMRSSGDLDEEYTPPVSKVLNPAFWADGRYYAEPITASILRAANAHDLTAPVAGREFQDAVNRRWEEPASANLRAEMLLATIAGKLPLLEGTETAVNDPEVDEAFAFFFSSQLPLPEDQPDD